MTLVCVCTIELPPMSATFVSRFHKGQLRPLQSNKSNGGASAGTLPLK